MQRLVDGLQALVIFLLSYCVLNIMYVELSMNASFIHKLTIFAEHGNSEMPKNEERNESSDSI